MMNRGFSTGRVAGVPTFKAVEDAAYLARQGLIGAAGGAAIKSAYKRIRGSQSSARKHKMKSIRKRLADFGQLERKIKRQALRDLGYKYRAKRPPKAAPMKAPGPLMGYGRKKFRKLRRAKTGVSKYFKHKADRRGSVTGSESVWLNVQGNAGYKEYLAAFADAFVRAVLARVQCHPSDVGENLSIGNVPNTSEVRIYVYYKGVRPDTGDHSTDVTDAVIIQHPNFTPSRTFEAVSDNMRNNLLAKIDDGYFPHEYSVYDETLGSYIIPVTGMDTSKVEMYVTSIITIQNQTLASGGTDTHDRLNIEAQSLKGKLYSFNNAAAEIREDLHANEAVFDKFHDELVDGGVQDFNVSNTTDHEALRHPMRPAVLFNNCRGVSDISLGPGAVKRQVLTLKYSGTLLGLWNKLLHRNSTTYQRRRAWGKALWFCFERTIRNGAVSATIAYNVEQHISSYVQLRNKRKALVRYDLSSV